jgi:hypothetical protein
MRHQRHFDTNTAAQREAAQIWKMIAELDRSVQLLVLILPSKRNAPEYLTDLTPPIRSLQGVLQRAATI